MNYYLPTCVEIGGEEYEIRSDYRAILDICIALSDVELTDQDRAIVALQVFYPEWYKIPIENLQEALEKCMWFIACGEDDTDNKKPQPKLVDWEQDFSRMISPINKVAGRDIRGDEYLHWWTFISYYSEIDSECVFSQIISIRSKKAKGQKLTKEEQKWYRDNRSMVDIKRTYTESEKDTISEWIGG